MNEQIHHTRARVGGFTLVELIVSMAVLVILLALITQLFNAASTVTTTGNKHMDSDAQARTLLDRMAIDIGAMVKRADVDYYLKGRPVANNQTGDDQIAFFSEVPGYYPSTGNQSPVSVVAYRKNSSNYRMERYSKGLLWNGATATDTPVVFLPIPLASPLPSPLPSPMPAAVPTPAWPNAASASATDTDYEQIGPEVFRFEYYYVLKGQDVSTNPSILSDKPWDSRAPLSHDSASGMRDVAAIGAAIAVIDSKSRVLVSDTQLQTLAGQLTDFSNTLKPGELEANWQNAINASSLPKVAAAAIRIYRRTFYLDTSSR